MTQDTVEKAPPTLQELEGKVQRLTTQVASDGKAKATADEQFSRAVKSGDVDLAIAAGDARTATRSTLSKSESQLKTATSAVNSQKLSANAGKRADVHNAMRQDKSVVGHVNALFSLGAEWVKLEKSEDGTLVINSGGADIKASRKSSGGGGGGSRGTASWEVDGQSFTSRELIDAHQDMLTDKVREHFDSGNFRAFSMTREAERIHGLLTSGN
ncbi:hypothetical protein LCGC14_1610200 [marine sediment metagenome]|uniref:Uncharacterized protein n=1 Tax=marine sediment metagenome TaxID=412755 RepID=A0A0F9I8I7_9ZZZZ